jgi:5-methylcytosine-specific restriction endonuclease McrA
MGRIKIKQRKCFYCEREVSRKPNIYCSFECQMTNQYKNFIDRWLKNEVDGTRGVTISQHVRRYLHEINNKACQTCGWSKISLHTGKIPLEVNHIDGNYKNSIKENLELLCPNCHSLTKNYGSLNIGNGRPYKRVKK